MRKTLDRFSVASSQSSNAALAIAQAQIDECMTGVKEHMRTTSERRLRQIKELMNNIRRQNN